MHMVVPVDMDVGQAVERPLVEPVHLLQAIGRDRFGVDGAEDVDHLRIELGAGVVAQLMKGLGVGQCRAVGPVVDHGVVRIGDRDDARADRDLVALQAVRVAASVEALVVVEHHRDGLAQARRLLQDDLADAGMLADRLPLLVAERGGLVEDLVGDGDLAEIVEERRDADALDLLAGEAHLEGDACRQRRDHVGRAAAVVRLRRQDRCERLRRRVARPTPEGSGLGPVSGGDRGTPHRRPFVELAEHVDAVATERLGGVHRRIGAVDDHVQLQLRPGASGNADADGGPDLLVAGDAQRLAHDQVAQLLGDADGVLRGRLRQDEHELLAAVASEGVTGPHGAADEARHLAQHGVAGVVPVDVVDRLEAVDVDERDAERLVVARRALDLRMQRGEQGLAVRDAGEAVVGRALLGQQVGACGRVEGAGQAALGGDPALAQVYRLLGLQGPLQRPGDAAQAPAEVAPCQQRHRGHPGHDRDSRGSGKYEAVLRRGLGGHGEPGDEGGRDGEGCQKAEGTDQGEHVIEDGAGVPRPPWVDRHAVRVGTPGLHRPGVEVRSGAVLDPYHSTRGRGAP